jgi:hypothetical protein
VLGKSSPLNFGRGERCTPAAATAAGLRKNDANLRRAKSVFRKMTKAHWAKVLRWLDAGGR